MAPTMPVRRSAEDIADDQARERLDQRRAEREAKRKRNDIRLETAIGEYD